MTTLISASSAPRANVSAIARKLEPLPDIRTPSFNFFVMPFASEYDTRISGTPRYTLTVKPLEQRDGVLARDSRQVLEAPDVESRRSRLLLRQQLPQLSQRTRMEHQLFADLHQHFVAQQDGDDLLCPCAIDRKLHEHFLDRRNLQSRGLERVLNLLMRRRFVVA